MIRVIVFELVSSIVLPAWSSLEEQHFWMEIKFSQYQEDDKQKTKNKRPPDQLCVA